MKYIISLLFFLMSTLIFAQKVTDYQYVIVPEKYDFFKKADQHQLNSLTKFLFNKYGFEAYIETDKKPFNMADAVCDVLYADIKEDSNFIKTRLAILLKDCNGNTIYKTTQGFSKKKAYKDAYHEALRDAFTDIKELNYKFNGSKEVVLEEPVQKAPKVVEVKEIIQIEEPHYDQDAAQKAVSDIEEEIVPVNNTSKIANNTSKPDFFMSEDGFYKAVRFGDSITFYEGDKGIGSSSILREDGFLVTTSQFEGNAFFREGRLIVERKIRGVVEVVEMIFTKQ